jgi:hypothetical protein
MPKHPNSANTQNPYNIPDYLCTRSEINLQTSKFNWYLRLGIILRGVPHYKSSCTYPWELFRRVSIQRIIAYTQRRDTGFSKREMLYAQNDTSAEGLVQVRKMQAILDRLPADGLPDVTDGDMETWRQRKLEQHKQKEEKRRNKDAFLRKFVDGAKPAYTKADLFKLLNSPCPSNFDPTVALLDTALRYGWNFDLFSKGVIPEDVYEDFLVKERKLRASALAREREINRRYNADVLDRSSTYLQEHGETLTHARDRDLAAIQTMLRDAVVDAYVLLLRSAGKYVKPRDVWPKIAESEFSR